MRKRSRVSETRVKKAPQERGDDGRQLARHFLKGGNVLVKYRARHHAAGEHIKLRLDQVLFIDLSCTHTDISGTTRVTHKDLRATSRTKLLGQNIATIDRMIKRFKLSFNLNVFDGHEEDCREGRPRYLLAIGAMTIGG